ncbi:MAG: DNA translocase FtsK [Paramuribaculum sp.]|nr:DNA translocase FtsK [Paramuribaculum sp.]
MILIFFSQTQAICRFIGVRLQAQRQRISEMNARHIARSEERRRLQEERKAAQQAQERARVQEQSKEQPHVTMNAPDTASTSNHSDTPALTDNTDTIEQSESFDLYDEIPTSDSVYTDDTDNTTTQYNVSEASENSDFAPEPKEGTELPENTENSVSIATTTASASIDNVPITVSTPQIEQYTEVEAIEHRGIDTSYDHTAELGRFRFPSLDLLTEREEKQGVVDLEEQEANKERITRTLNSYGVEIASIKATVGPTITLYEIVPAEGVRIAKIKHLGDDMALNLAALGIRIIAPMPGRGTIGMEVPNSDPQIVSIRSILSSKAYIETKAKLPLAIGTTIQNEVYIADLAKIPHLLVAGATGMGKSVGLNAIIASLLYKKHPSELKFVLIDPKMVEFSLYSKLERHYLAKLPDEEEPIITEPSKAVTTLNSLCVEMQNRLALLKKAGMRNIAEYNDIFTSRRLSPEKGHRFLPYIVVIIDEFADLLMTTGKELETPVARLAQKARAVGIHLILATQRPSVDVITGMIKNNFPGRVAFRVSAAVDSRTILDRPGAEQLIGRGDMLFSQDGKIQRVQCALIETSEVELICDSISEQIGYPCAYELPEYVPANESATGNLNAVGERDPLFEDAGRTIIESGTGSTSLLQRKYNIGYPRAGKIMDQLEAAGVVGPAQGGKPRQLLMDSIAFDIMLTNQA